MVNTVGIRGCGIDTAPLFSVYVNSLAGVSMKKMDAIADEETKTFKGVWDELNERAVLRFEHEVNKIQNESYKLCKISKVVDFGKLLQETEIAPATEWRGFTLESNYEQGVNPYYKESALSEIYVDEISIWSKDVQSDVPIKVFDLADGTVLYSTTADLVAGWSDININQSFNALNIYVAYWGQLVTSRKIQLKNPCDCGCCNVFYRSTQFDAALSTDTVTPDDLTYGYDSIGLTGCWSLRCTWKNLICCAKNDFVYAWQKCLGYEFFDEITMSDRLNRFTTIDKKKAQDRKEELLTDYSELLRDVLKGITIDQHDCCVECNEPLTVKEWKA